MSRPVRSAEVTELRALCAAIDLGSLGRAARLLGVSQPALSKRLRTLEALAGAPLLDRSSRGVTPTAAGARLYAEASKLLRQAEVVDGLLAGLSAVEAPVRLGASHTIAEFVLPGPLVEFERQRRRHLSVELIIANSLVVRELVREGRAEFGIAAGEAGGTAGLWEEFLCDDEVVVAVPADHPWSQRAWISLAELATTAMVLRDPSAHTRRVVERALRERGAALRSPLAEVGSTSAAKDAAISERAPVLLSRLALRGESDRFAVIPVEGVRFAREFVLLTGAPETLGAGAQALLAHLREAINPA